MAAGFRSMLGRWMGGLSAPVARTTAGRFDAGAAQNRQVQAGTAVDENVDFGAAQNRWIDFGTASTNDA